MPKTAPTPPELAVRPHPHLLEIPLWTWLEELSLRQGRPVRLGHVPDAEWDRLEGMGFDLVWLMGVWRRSPQARQIFRNDSTRFSSYDHALPNWKLAEIVGSPYAVQDYRPEPRIGTWRDIDRARQKLHERGMGLILDFVPNHTALDHPWTKSHPEFYILGSEDDFRRDASLYFLREEADSTVRFFAHGRDPYFPAWPDTAQLNLFHAEARQTLLEVIRVLAEHADGLRCDMAMLALNEIFARTWSTHLSENLPEIEFWTQAIAMAPDLIWLGEAYWGTEPKLHELGFQFTYDKPFYDLLRVGSVPELRCRLALEASRDGHMARFLENHDEQRAAAVFGAERMQAAAAIASTAPGMRFYFHGQIEGRKIHVPIELGRAPEEPGNAAIREIYQRLLPIADDDVFHSGQWVQFEAESAGDASHANLVVYEWKSESVWKLIASNPSRAAAQGRVRLRDGVEGEAKYLLRDQLNNAEYPRTGRELAEGLYLKLESGRAHLFDIRRM